MYWHHVTENEQLTENQEYNIRYIVMKSLLELHPLGDRSYSKAQELIEYFEKIQDYEKCKELKDLIEFNKFAFQQKS